MRVNLAYTEAALAIYPYGAAMKLALIALALAASTLPAHATSAAEMASTMGYSAAPAGHGFRPAPRPAPIRTRPAPRGLPQRR